jgi:predicted phosphodiesterase
MRIAIVSDIHGNRTAFEAVLADLRETAPDLVLHGGDLSLSGASPFQIVDHIRDLGWPGVVGNVDEVLFRPVSVQEFAQQSTAPAELFTAIEEMAAVTRALLGEERLAWLRDLPRVQRYGSLVLVHALPEDLWRAPASNASDADLESAYGLFGDSVVVYGHIHTPYFRSVAGSIIANSGSIGLPYDGDPRASYLLLDEDKPSIRRVAYDLDKERKALALCGLPHADWIARTLRSALPEMP